LAGDGEVLKIVLGEVRNYEVHTGFAQALAKETSLARTGT
jgi:hypothetical protein